jgi:serine/threonine protein kinase
MSSHSFASGATKRSLRYIRQYDHYADFSQNTEVSKVNWSDVSVSSVLGNGGFSWVFRVTAPIGESSTSSGSNKPQECALKCLNSKTVTTENSFCAGASDLAREASILSQISHQNIIRLRAVSAETLSQSFLGTDGAGYFIILDVLEETLTDRLNRWKKVDENQKLLSLFRSSAHRRARKADIQQRLEDVVTSIARAMHYLHEHQIVHRDIKPANIGFDASGTLKLFDFGLARTLDCLSVSEVAGSDRYMAPEVMNGTSSGLPSDVYSFGVLMWQICTLKNPYANYMKNSGGKELFKRKVVLGSRPSLISIPSKHTRQLIQDCWDANPYARPSFSRILMLLSDIGNEKCHTSSRPKAAKTSSSRSRRSSILLKMKDETSSCSQSTAANSSVCETLCSAPPKLSKATINSSAETRKGGLGHSLSGFSTSTPVISST